MMPEVWDVQNIPSGSVGGRATSKKFVQYYQREVMVPVGRILGRKIVQEAESEIVIRLLVHKISRVVGDELRKELGNRF
jgi:hypothetical protein